MKNDFPPHWGPPPTATKLLVPREDKDSHRVQRLQKAREEIGNELWGDIAFSHSLLAQVNLPYRNLDPQREYSRVSGRVSLQLTAGSTLAPGGRGWRKLGLPYGARARLLLLHLCSLAVKQNSAVVETEASFTGFCRSLGIATNGQNQKAVRKQILRMSSVSMRLGWEEKNSLNVFQGPIFDGFRAQFTAHPDQIPIWSSEVQFSPRFFASLKNHAVPMDLRAIQALRHSPRCLDVYAWLSSRLWRVKRPTKVRWSSLQHQFGQPTQDRRSFKTSFRKALKQVLVVYPSARVDSVYGGIELHNSPPPIDPKEPGPQLTG